jgi:hypothetical protein
VYFKPKQKQSALDHQAMNAALDPAVSRFKARSEESPDEAELWRGKLQAFQNLYGFLSQVIPYQDSDLERLYVFVRHLMTKLPRRASGAAYQFDDEVKLEYYRLQKISEGSIALKDGEARKLDGPDEAGSGVLREQPCRSRSSSTSSTSASGPTSTRPISSSSTRSSRPRWATMACVARRPANPGDKFELLFKNVLERLFVDRMDQNEDIFVRFMNDVPFQKVVTSWMAEEAYRRLRPTTSRRSRAPHVRSLRLVEGARKERYVKCVPLVPLKAAAGAFSDPQHVADGDFEWVEVETAQRRLRPGMFVAQVVGRSMEPGIEDGSYCLFAAPVTGSRQGRTVLVQLRDVTDPETGHRYTVKRYESEKARVATRGGTRGSRSEADEPGVRAHRYRGRGGRRGSRRSPSSSRSCGRVSPTRRRSSSSSPKTSPAPRRTRSASSAPSPRR